MESHSISAGLDYLGVGPEHSWLKDLGRAQYRPVTDAEAMDALRLLSRTEMLDGQLHGRMQRFWPMGQQQLDAQYQAGRLHGLLQLYDEQGELVQSAQYRNGQQHGLTLAARELAQRAGAPVPGLGGAQGAFNGGVVGGLLDGDTVSYDEAGAQSARLHYQAGRLEGRAQFFLHGRLVRAVSYRAGLLEGEATDYDQEGTVVQTISHQANLPHGPTRRYWPDGQLMEEQFHQHGLPVAPPTRFDAKGRLLEAKQGTASLLARLEKLVRG